MIDSKTVLRFVAVVRFICISLFMMQFLSGAAFAGIPEPNAVIYGRVFNTAGGLRVPLTAGKIEWNLNAKGEERAYTFTGAVECTECLTYDDAGQCSECRGSEDYFFRIQVPQQAVIDMQTIEIPDDVVPLTETETQWDYATVMFDGAAAILQPRGEAGNDSQKTHDHHYMVAAQNRRAFFYQVDLEVVIEPTDTDGDGIPDWWEQKYGLNPFDNSDASENPDNDGWDNLEEFTEGGDPGVDNNMPFLNPLFRKLRVSEGGKSMVRFVIMDADSDYEQRQIKIVSAPEGGVLIQRGYDSGDGVFTERILAEGDEFTYLDVRNAAIYFKHTDWKITDCSFSIALKDETQDNYPEKTYTVEMMVRSPSRTDGTDARYWADSWRNKADENDDGTLGPDNFLDYSGTELYSPYYGDEVNFNSVFSIGLPPFESGAGPVDKPILRFDGTQGFQLPYGTPVFPRNDMTLFAMIRSVGSKNQALIASPHFHFGTAGNAHPTHPNELRYSTPEGSVYGNRNVKNEWIAAGLTRSSDEVGIEINGIRTGGPYMASEQNEMATDPQVGMNSLWIWDFNKQEYTLDETDFFEGDLAEILVFDQQLPNVRKWRTYGYLMSKWTGAAMLDMSDETRSTGLRAPSRNLATYDTYESEYVETYGRDFRYILIGGEGKDYLYAGFEDDILVGGPGNDSLEGNGGRDVFVVDDGDIVRDFNESDGDILSIAHLLNGTSRDIFRYVHLETDGANSFLKIDSNGDGTGFTDAQITLWYTILRDSDIARLWANGLLQTGGIRMPLTTRMKLHTPETNETDGMSATFKVIFDNAVVPEGLTVPLIFEGDAEFGIDYRIEAMVYDSETGDYKPEPVENGPIPVKLKPGDTTLTVNLIPIADGVNELVETARVGLMPNGDFYDLGDPSVVEINLSDGPDRVSIAATGPAAHESGQMTGRVTLSRTGTVEKALNVNLSVQGTAVNGTDIDFIPSEIEIPAGRVTATIAVTAKTDEETEPNEYAEIRVLPGDGYATAGAASVRVTILDITAPLNIPDDGDGDGLPDEWEARYGLNTALDDADEDPDGDGFTNAQEHVCGTNPVDADSVPSPSPPMVDAGPDQVVAPGAMAALSALNSFGIHQEPLTFTWTQPDGTAVDLSDNQSAQPSFSAPDGVGALVFELTAESPCGGTSTDMSIVNVTSDGLTPKAVASADPDILVEAGDEAVLSADGSTNIDGTAGGLTHFWRQIQGPEAALSDPTAANPSFTAPATDTALIFELIVTNDLGLKARDRVVVNVGATGQPPQASAAIDPNSVEEGTTATLSVTGGTAWRWRQIAGPPATISDPTSRTPSISVPAVGPDGADLVFQATVTGDDGLITLTETTLRVTDADGSTPPGDTDSDGGSGGGGGGGGGGCFIGTATGP